MRDPANCPCTLIVVEDMNLCDVWVLGGGYGGMYARLLPIVLSIVLVVSGVVVCGGHAEGLHVSVYI